MQPGTKGFLIALAYGVASASMAFVNKAVLSYYAFDYPFFLVTVQMLFTVILLESLNIVSLVVLVPITLDKCREFFFPSLFYAVNAVLGLSALSGMNIPMYGMVKRCTPLVVLILGSVLLGKGRPGSLVCLSVGMITLGCVVAGLGDLAFDLHAYMYGLASVVSQALYQVLVQRRAPTLHATDTLHLNSYNTLPILAMFSLATGEMKKAVRDFDLTNVGFLVSFTTVISMGCVLNYLLFLCITFNSALTTSITGTLKSIVQTLIGIFTFGGINLNVFTVSGIIINLMGGAVYSFVKYFDSRRKALVKAKSAARDLEKIVVSSEYSVKSEITNSINGAANINDNSESHGKLTRLHRSSMSESEHTENIPVNSDSEKR